jgi:DNA-binding response OmpR family regulator
MLLLASNEKKRRQLADGLRAVGFPVLSVASIGEIERWPVGDIVITDAAHFTPWWKKVGATHVIVIVASRREGARLCARGATGWITRGTRPEQLVGVVQALLVPLGSPSATTPELHQVAVNDLAVQPQNSMCETPGIPIVSGRENSDG